MQENRIIWNEFPVTEGRMLGPSFVIEQIIQTTLSGYVLYWPIDFA